MSVPEPTTYDLCMKQLNEATWIIAVYLAKNVLCI